MNKDLIKLEVIFDEVETKWHFIATAVGLGNETLENIQIDSKKEAIEELIYWKNNNEYPTEYEISIEGLDVLKIIDEARKGFSIMNNNGKVLIWSKVNINRFNYEIVEEEEFLQIIQDRYLDLIDSADDEEMKDIDYDKVFNNEFDEEFKGVEGYYDPFEKFKDEEYKYCYLITYVKSAQNYAQDIVYIVNSNKEISNFGEMNNILNEYGYDIPGQFGAEWANHSFEDLNKFSRDGLYELYSENDDFETICVD